MAEAARDLIRDKISSVHDTWQQVEDIVGSLGEEQKIAFLNFKQTLGELEAEQQRSEEEIVKHEISGYSSKYQSTFDQNDSLCGQNVDDVEERTEKPLEQLVEDKVPIEKHSDMLKVALNDSNMSKEDCHNILVEIQRNEEEHELRTAQITDLKQRVAESNQDIKIKAKFNSNLRDPIVEYQNKIETLEKELAEADTNTEAQKTALEKEYAEKILLLLYQLSDKDISINTAAENTGLDVQLTHRLQIQIEQLRKLKTLRQDLEKQIDKNSKLRLRLTELDQAQTSKDKSLNKRRSWSTSALNESTEIQPTRFVELSSSEDEDMDDAKNDPDWRKTPLYERLQQLKVKYQGRENRNLKRKSDDTLCTCKSSCKKRCSCVRNSNSCSNACKCSGVGLLKTELWRYPLPAGTFRAS
ncbi:unnamed protein product [Bemisia tabaci]|uniref:Uncharacterized protein n=1 Tax=Bemisia tabaci TaxID=7038 RepID=A0A9P0FA72_BEMTA|nr:unnamed protein product [Bemisia tabaci]